MVRLVTASGENTTGAWHFRDADLNTGPLLEALAVVTALEQVRLDSGWLSEPSGGGLTVAVLGEVRDLDIPVLRRMQHHTSSAIALALDVNAWSTPNGGDGGAGAILTQLGWRSATLRPRDRLDAVWQELGRSSTQSSRAESGAAHQEVVG